MKLIKTGLATFAFVASAFPLTVDFAPIQVGNVWVFEQSYNSVTFHSIPEYKITKTIQIIKTNAKSDTTFFTAFVKDSGVVLPNAPVNAAYYVDGFKTKDTLYSKKSDDSIAVSEHGIENFDLGEFFPYPTRDTAIHDTTGYLTEKYGLMEGKIVGTYVYYHLGGFSFLVFDTCIILQDLGLLYRYNHSENDFSGDAVGGNTITILISFNGNSVPVVHTPVNNSWKASFTGRQNIYSQLLLRANGRLMMPQDGRTYFDVRGRLVSVPNNAHQRIVSGILFFKKAGNVTQQ